MLNQVGVGHCLDVSVGLGVMNSRFRGPMQLVLIPGPSMFVQRHQHSLTSPSPITLSHNVCAMIVHSSRAS